MLVEGLKWTKPWLVESVDGQVLVMLHAMLSGSHNRNRDCGPAARCSLGRWSVGSFSRRLLVGWSPLTRSLTVLGHRGSRALIPNNARPPHVAPLCAGPAARLHIHTEHPPPLAPPPPPHRSQRVVELGRRWTREWNERASRTRYTSIIVLGT